MNYRDLDKTLKWFIANWQSFFVRQPKNQLDEFIWDILSRIEYLMQFFNAVRIGNRSFENSYDVVDLVAKLRTIEWEISRKFEIYFDIETEPVY